MGKGQSLLQDSRTGTDSGSATCSSGLETRPTTSSLVSAPQVPLLLCGPVSFPIYRVDEKDEKESRFLLVLMAL